MVGGEPLNIFAALEQGNSANWADAPFVDTEGRSYNSASWALTYEIRGPKRLTLNAAVEGVGWRTSITTVQSETLTPGTYYWSAYATKAGERVTAGSGTFVVKANLADIGTDGYDGRSQAEKDLAAINAEISARASGGFVAEYAIGDRSLKREPTSELLVLKSRFEAIVARERAAENIANGLGNPRRVLVRFQ